MKQVLNIIYFLLFDVYIFSQCILLYLINIHMTATTSSSARILPKSRKLKDNGFVKSSNMFIGSKIGVG